jgi:N-acetylglucosaminyldiphosphoundecaprenol N-acetyl-beta-D-mannosaminyltransferase
VLPDVHLFEPSGYAGVFQHTVRIAQLLEGAGVRAVVHTGHQHEDVDGDQPVELCGCSWWPRDETRGAGRSREIARRFFASTLPHLHASSDRGSVVHLEGIAATGYLNAVALWAGRLDGRRVVYSPHDAFSRRGRLDAMALRLALRAPHDVLVHAERDVDLLRRMGIDALYSPLVQVVPSPSPEGCARWRERWGAGGEDQVVLFAGWIRPEKRLDLVIESAREWPSNRRLAVLGRDRGGWAECEALARRYGVAFTADVDFVDLADFTAAIAAADVVVAPHERASQSGVLSLASHLGVPAVAADVGGLRELAARTFAVGDVAALSRALDEVLANPGIASGTVDEDAALAAHLRAYGLAGSRRESERIRVMEMPLDAVTFADAVSRVETGMRGARGGAVLTPNLDVLRQYQRSPGLREAFESIELLVADGVPLVWASRLQGTPVPARITGTDMLWAAVELAAKHHASVFLAGGRPDVGARAAARLREAHPGLEVLSYPCFVRPGPIGAQLDELAAEIEAAQPGVVLIALPFPVQVHLIARMRRHAQSAWFVGIGSSLDFVNGDRARAPEWLQRLGLEWAHRVVLEPRVARRYLVHGIPFAVRLGMHALRGRRRSTAPPLHSASS